MLLVFPLLFLHFYSVHLQKKSISRTVEEWKSVYHINSQQAGRIKQIEFDFHGSGSPFSFLPVHTKEETHRHHQEIGGIMPPADGARFIKVMEKSDGRH